MPESRVYRPRRARGIFVLLLSTCFAAVGLLVLTAVGWKSWYFYGAFLGLGILGVVAAYAALRIRIVVDDFSIAEVSLQGGGFRASWDNVERWMVTRVGVTPAERQHVWSKLYAGNPPWLLPSFLDGEDYYVFKEVALFKIRGKRWPVAVYDCEAWRPSFDAFVEDVRAHARAKEVVLVVSDHPPMR